MIGAYVTVTEALCHCHKRWLVHSDIKPQNLLLSAPNNDATLKLADFGVCFEHQRSGGWAGTANYLPSAVLEMRQPATLLIESWFRINTINRGDELVVLKASLPATLKENNNKAIIIIIWRPLTDPQDYYGAACCIYEMVEKNVMNEAADPSLRPPGRPNLESVKWRHHQGVLKKTLDKFIDIDNPKAVPQMASNIIKDLLNAVESKVSPPVETWCVR